MADADRQLNIKVAVVADTTGITDTTKALAQLGDESKKQTTDNTELSDSTKKYIHTLEEQEREEKTAVASKGEIRHGLREIGRELPLLGEAGRIAIDPLIGGFVLLASEVSSALDSIKELGDRSTPEFARLTDAVEKQKEAIEDVDLAAKAYERSLARLAQAKDSVEDTSKAFTSDVNAKGNAELSAADANQKKLQALLEAQEQAQLITHAEYIAKKLQLDEDYAKHRLEIENRLAAADVIQKYTERAKLYIEANNLKAGLGAKTDAAKDADGKSAFAQDRTSKDQADLKATEDKLAELQKEAVDLHDKTTGLGRFHTMEPQYLLEKRKAQNEQETADQMAIADRLRNQIKSDKDRGATAKDKAAAAKESLDTDRTRLSHDTERINQLDRELPRDTRDMQEGIANRNSNAEIESQTRIINAAKETARAGEAHTANIAQDLHQITQIVTTGHGNLARSIANLRRDLERNIDTIHQNLNTPVGGH